MSKFNELLQNYVDTDHDTLVGLARESYIKINPLFKRLDEKNDGALAMISVLNAGIGADGTLTAKERQFLSEALSLQPETVDGMIKLFTGKEFELVDLIADNATEDEKFHIFNLMAVLAACDNTITREESEFLLKIME